MTLFRWSGRPTPVERALAALDAELRDAKLRQAEALHLVDEALSRQSDLHADDRNRELLDLCLEVRGALAPPPGSQLLRRPAPFARGRAR